MPSYAAFIGHQPHLSLAELAATVPGFLLHEKIDRTVVLFDSAKPLDAAFLDTLGGTVVLAQKLEGNPVIATVHELLAGKLMAVKGKATFSLRTLGLAPREVKDLYRKSKEHMRKKGKPTRYVGNESRPAPSIVLRENKLLDGSGGCEVVIIRKEISTGKDTETLLWIGATVGAQDIDSYTLRDMEKPVRDTGVGLLPPKLAQIMLNLGAWLTKGKNPMTVLDPFCGTGVIPIECLIRGFPVVASDKSEKAVTGCTKNLEWLRKEFEIKKSDTPSRVWKQDATKPFEMKESVDVIVTETSLGPSLERRPTAKDVQKMKTENEQLQIAFLKNCAATLPGVPVVCTWPVWYPSKAPVFLEKVWKAAADLGYQAVLPPTIEIMNDRVSLLYRRPDQFVGREVVMLKAKKGSGTK